MIDIKSISSLLIFNMTQHCNKMLIACLKADLYMNLNEIYYI